jgi:hypothetical protein
MRLNRLWQSSQIAKVKKELLHLLFSPKKPEPQQTLKDTQIRVDHYHTHKISNH